MLTAQDCALILGFPGTGKSSTIAAAIMALLHQGKSVLVSAYTNSAVDAILVKLAKMGAPILRLGRAENVHPALKGFTLGSDRYTNISAAGLKKIAREATLVRLFPVPWYADVLSSMYWKSPWGRQAGDLRHFSFSTQFRTSLKKA